MILCSLLVTSVVVKVADSSSPCSVTATCISRSLESTLQRSNFSVLAAPLNRKVATNTYDGGRPSGKISLKNNVKNPLVMWYEAFRVSVSIINTSGDTFYPDLQKSVCLGDAVAGNIIVCPDVSSFTKIPVNHGSLLGNQLMSVTK